MNSCRPDTGPASTSIGSGRSSTRALMAREPRTGISVVVVTTWMSGSGRYVVNIACSSDSGFGRGLEGVQSAGDSATQAPGAIGGDIDDPGPGGNPADLVRLG